MLSRTIVAMEHRAPIEELEAAQLLLKLLMTERWLVKYFVTLLLQKQLHLKLLAFGYLELKGTRTVGGVCRS